MSGEADSKVEVLYTDEEIRDLARAAVRRMAEEVSRKIAGSARTNLEEIRATSKHPRKGGYGWWSPKIKMEHGFTKSSIESGDYVTKAKEPGGYVKLTSLFFPIEYGTKRGKRGWYARGSSAYTTRRRKRRKSVLYVEEYTGNRGPSEKKPFLRPAVWEHQEEAEEVVKRTMQLKDLIEG